MDFSTVIIIRFVSKPYDYGFQYCHNPTAGNFQNIQLNTNKKGTKFAEPCNNVIMPHSPRDSGKNAVLVPPKLSSELDCCAVYVPRTVLEALGRHFFQSHSENCGIISHNLFGCFWFMKQDLGQKDTHSWIIWMPQYLKCDSKYIKASFHHPVKG